MFQRILSPRVLNSQSGFSLVELMVVVAIIGILAMMSVGAVQKQIAKARQSEARTNLGSYYTSQKAFYAEYNIYAAEFGTIRFGLEGDLRYNLGTGAAGPNAAALTGAGVPATQQFAAGAARGQAEISAATYCPNKGTAAAADESPTCATLSSARAALQAGSVVTATTFIGEAFNDDLYKTNDDRWVINENKVVTQTLDGIRE